MKRLTLPPSFFVCTRCGRVVTGVDGIPGAEAEVPGCANGETGHWLVREVDPEQLGFPEMGPAHPFLRFRGLLHAYHLARSAGASDADCFDEIETLDEEIPSPPRLGLRRAETLEEALGQEPAGGFWAKVERPASLRYRRDFGLALGRAFASRWLSMASPGTSSAGLLDSGYELEGSMSLGWEIAAELGRARLAIDRIFLGVGDGRMASGVVEGLREAVRLGGLPRLPRIHLVEANDTPLGDLCDHVTHAILRRVHAELVTDRILEAVERFPRVRQQIGDSLRAGLERGPTDSVRVAVEAELQREARGGSLRSDQVPAGWFALVRGMLESGGFPLSVDEEHLVLGRELASGSGLLQENFESELGAASMAGMIRLRSAGDLGLDERVVFVLS